MLGLAVSIRAAEALCGNDYRLSSCNGAVWFKGTGGRSNHKTSLSPWLLRTKKVKAAEESSERDCRRQYAKGA